MSQVDPQLVFELARRFYRTKSSSFTLDYDAKIATMALYKQATLGTYETGKDEEPGFFDFVGKDIRAAWQNLGDMPKEEAQEKFSDLLAEAVPPFRTWLEERLREKAERERRERERLEQERLERERQEQERLRREQEELRQKQEAEMRRREQERLRLLSQEEHTRHSTPQQQSAPAASSGFDPAFAEKGADLSRNSPEYIKAFRGALQGNPDSEVVVNSGEVLTIRVPKPKSSKEAQISWQFHTLDYDISFGVDFEEEQDPAQQQDATAVHLEPILPVMRCNSHLEVIGGSHISSKHGTWLLKFDNSYSYFRSKTVLYRVLCSAF